MKRFSYKLTVKEIKWQANCTKTCPYRGIMGLSMLN
jgi:hypothetical protein